MSIHFRIVKSLFKCAPDLKSAGAKKKYNSDSFLYITRVFRLTGSGVEFIFLLTKKKPSGKSQEPRRGAAEGKSGQNWAEFLSFPDPDPLLGKAGFQRNGYRCQFSTGGGWLMITCTT